MQHAISILDPIKVLQNKKKKISEKAWANPTAKLVSTCFHKHSNSLINDVFMRARQNLVRINRSYRSYGSRF